MSLLKLTAIFLLAVLGAAAQQSGIRVRAVRVLATDPEALAIFYEKAFGMSEIRRPVNSATTKEIVVNSGDTVEAARAAQTAPIVIYTRPKDAAAGVMASLILNVPDLNKAIESVRANGGTVLRPAAENLNYAFVKDPDGNQIELVVAPKS